MRRAGLALALVAAVAVALSGAPSGRSAEGGLPDPLPELGTADAEMMLMGGAAEASEAWGYRLLPLDAPAPTVGGQPLAFGPLPEGRDVRQLAFLRRPGDGPWAIADVPLDADGAPYRGPAPNPQSAEITPKGGGLLVGRDQLRPPERQLVTLVRDPGGRYRERVPDAAALEAGEALASDSGAGRVAAAAFAAGDRTGAYFGALGPEVEDTVVRFDGQAWSREDVTLPAGVTSARFVALAAASETAAWALLETTSTDGRGIELYRRDASGPDPVWAPVSLAGSAFADRADAARGISELGPLTGAADALTATTDGVWVDGELTVTAGGGDPRTSPFTLYVKASGTLGGSWCDARDGADARICAHDLGADLDTALGYRSFAWTGGGPSGSRVITNPLDPGGDSTTNRGTYLRFAGEAFERRRGATGNGHPSGAFLSADKGFLEGPIEIGAAPQPTHLRRWPLAVRAPLTAAVTAPGTQAGDVNAGALAVGADGAVARYVPAQGWQREFLLTANGSVARPRLRGVAWPEVGRAVAVGDQGAMWQWRSDTGLWERDPATPIGFEGQLMDVAFQPGRDDRGYAVGRAGVLLRYDKTWTQEALPAEFAQTDLTSVSFAAGRAMVAAGADVLVSDGAGWAPDLGLRALLDTIRRGRPQVRVVRGLADGGAVAAGRGFVAVQDAAGGAWRFTSQPLPDATVVAAAPFRAGGAVRALVAVQPRVDYPVLEDPLVLDPNVPAPVLPAQPLPGDGYVLRETDGGWRDERRSAFPATGVDRPIKTDPISAFLVDPNGEGWALGGWSGEPDFAGRGTKVAADRTRVQTAAVFRLSAGEAGGPPAATTAAVTMPAGPVRLAVGGHAECEDPCAALADQQLAPDRLLRAAIEQASRMAADPSGPRAFLNTGGRLAPKGDRGLSAGEAARYAQLLGSPANLPVFSAVSQSDSAGPGGAAAYTGALASAPAPMGATGGFGAITADTIPGITASAGARTHYAFDVDGKVRVVVIDNSRGSLADSDPHQNPAEPQLPWLQSVLADARSRGLASIVVGSRDLSRFAPRLNAATDGDVVAQALVDGGASAYFYERPEENRAVMIPSGGATQIPAYGTGTLGYRSPLQVAAGQDVPLSAFGERQFLLAEIDVTRRDPGTGRAPVTVRPVPVIEDLSLQAVDGTLLRRSRPALFQGLGRRPESGDRWGEPAGAGGPSPPGGDPYAVLPAEPCLTAGCSTRLAPEVEFTSSDPDIADFVQADPNSTNVRKPLLGPDDKVITDPKSGLLCPFNAGTTTVTIKAGGIAVAQKITVLAGTAARPCGTRPLNPSRFERPAPQTPAVQQPQLPAIAPSVPPTPEIEVPDAPAAPVPTEPVPTRPERTVTPVTAAQAPPPLLPVLATPVAALGTPPVTPPPPAGGFARPIPPGGVAVRVYEEKREEEVAPEQSQAFSRYDADERRIPIGPATIGAVVLLALAGAELRNGPRRRARRRLATATVRSENPYRRTHR